MVTLEGSGITARLPAGWEGEITSDHGLLSDGSRRPTLGHFANFPLPRLRGDYGSGAVESMEPGDVMVMLFEFDRESAGSALFAHEGVPHPLVAGDFDRNGLQRTIQGQSGVQRFFSQSGRAFCLYVVAGSHIDRADVLPAVNSVLATIEIES